jgi:hypothetical protein
VVLVASSWVAQRAQQQALRAQEQPLEAVQPLVPQQVQVQERPQGALQALSRVPVHQVQRLLVVPLQVLILRLVRVAVWAS